MRLVKERIQSTVEAFRTDTLLSEQFYKRPPSQTRFSQWLPNKLCIFTFPKATSSSYGHLFRVPRVSSYENFHCISHARLIWELVTQSNSDTSIAWSYTTINICSYSNNVDLSKDKLTTPQHLLKTFFIGWWGDMKPLRRITSKELSWICMPLKDLNLFSLLICFLPPLTINFVNRPSGFYSPVSWAGSRNFC